MRVGYRKAVRRFYAQYARFSGRAGRSEYWWSVLYLVLLAVGLSSLARAAVGSLTGDADLAVMLSDLVLLAFWAGHIMPIIAVSVRRLHDVDLSGWFYLLGLVPLVGGIVLAVLLLVPPRPRGARFER